MPLRFNADAEVVQIGVQCSVTAMMCPGHVQAVFIRVADLQYVWPVGSRDSESCDSGLLQPFLNYNFGGGLYLTSAPVATVNWKADSGDRWTVPLGGGVGRIFHVGKPGWCGVSEGSGTRPGNL